MRFPGISGPDLSETVVPHGIRSFSAMLSRIESKYYGQVRITVVSCRRGIMCHSLWSFSPHVARAARSDFDDAKALSRDQTKSQRPLWSRQPVCSVHA